MGERCDNFAFAFDGRTVDWNRVFGMRFNDAPKGWVTVYRECAVEDLIRIAREGLSGPDPDMRYPEARQELELLDQNRPTRFVEKGVSRIGAIGAVLSPEDASGWQFRRSVMLEMKIDPKYAIVCDCDRLDQPSTVAPSRRAREERYKAAFRDYWESAVPLTSFLRHYSKVETAEDTHWIAARRTPTRLPRTFFAPEVLVTQPAISSQHIRIMRGSPVGEERRWA